jgi:hypothetical protein
MIFDQLPGTTVLVQCHLVCHDFNYRLAVEWAAQLLGTPYETESVLIVASFGPNAARSEIQPYVSAALRELELTEYEDKEGVRERTNYYVTRIILGIDIRSSLTSLRDLCIETKYESDLMPFYLIHCGWSNLDLGFEDHYAGQTVDTIQSTLIQESHNWKNNFYK